MGFGAPAKPFRMALGALIIKARLGLTDEELVEQIKENPYLQFFIGLEAFQYSAPFDPSMMVYFRKRLPEAVVNQGLLEVCPSSHGSVVALTVLCAGTALDSWLSIPPPRLLLQAI
jgi:hypothetical protein